MKSGINSPVLSLPYLCEVLRTPGNGWDLVCVALQDQRTGQGFINLQNTINSLVPGKKQQHFEHISETDYKRITTESTLKWLLDSIFKYINSLFITDDPTDDIIKANNGAGNGLVPSGNKSRTNLFRSVYFDRNNFLTNNFHCTVWCRYIEVNFLQNSHSRHPIAQPWRQGMGCLFSVTSLKSDLRSLTVIAVPYVISW